MGKGDKNKVNIAELIRKCKLPGLCLFVCVKSQTTVVKKIPEEVAARRNPNPSVIHSQNS